MLTRSDHIAEFNEEHLNLFQKLPAPKDVVATALSSPKKTTLNEFLEWLLTQDPDPECCLDLLEFLSEKNGHTHPLAEKLIQHYLPLFAKEENAAALRRLVEVRNNPQFLLFLLKQWETNPDLSYALSIGLIQLAMNHKLLEDPNFTSLLTSLSAILNRTSKPPKELYVLIQYMLILRTKMSEERYQIGLSIVMENMHYFPMGKDNPLRFEIYYTLLVLIENIAKTAPEYPLIPAQCLKLMKYVELQELAVPVDSPMPPMLLFFLEHQFIKVQSFQFHILATAALNTLLTLCQHYTFTHLRFSMRQGLLELLACMNLTPMTADDCQKAGQLVKKLLNDHRPSTHEEECQWIGCIQWGLGFSIKNTIPPQQQATAFLTWITVLAESPIPGCRGEAKRLYQVGSSLIEKLKPCTIEKLRDQIFNG